jgi:hypothetical protein
MNVKYSGVAVLAAALLSFAVLPATAQESENTSLTAAVKSGEAHLGFRYRFENVDQDGISDDANASTVRLRLNYRTGPVLSSLTI